jgi:hypothetical protein
MSSEPWEPENVTRFVLAFRAPRLEPVGIPMHVDRCAATRLEANYENLSMLLLAESYREDDVGSPDVYR